MTANGIDMNEHRCSDGISQIRIKIGFCQLRAASKPSKLCEPQFLHFQMGIRSLLDSYEKIGKLLLLNNPSCMLEPPWGPYKPWGACPHISWLNWSKAPICLESSLGDFFLPFLLFFPPFLPSPSLPPLPHSFPSLPPSLPTFLLPFLCSEKLNTGSCTCMLSSPGDFNVQVAGRVCSRPITNALPLYLPSFHDCKNFISACSPSHGIAFGISCQLCASKQSSPPGCASVSSMVIED
jgi:hypothetical protein